MRMFARIDENVGGYLAGYLRLNPCARLLRIKLYDACLHLSVPNNSTHTHKQMQADQTRLDSYRPHTRPNSFKTWHGAPYRPDSDYNADSPERRRNGGGNGKYRDSDKGGNKRWSQRSCFSWLPALQKHTATWSNKHCELCQNVRICQIEGGFHDVKRSSSWIEV